MVKYDPKWEENLFDLTLNEAELRTINGALSDYYHHMMEMKSLVLEGIHPNFLTKDPTKEQWADANRTTNRCLNLMMKIRKLCYEDDL